MTSLCQQLLSLFSLQSASIGPFLFRPLFPFDEDVVFDRGSFVLNKNDYEIEDTIVTYLLRQLLEYPPTEYNESVDVVVVNTNQPSNPNTTFLPTPSHTLLAAQSNERRIQISVSSHSHNTIPFFHQFSVRHHSYRTATPHTVCPHP